LFSCHFILIIIIGVYVYDTGDRYEGQFNKGVREGIGKYTSVDGWYYSGGYKDGERYQVIVC
jgi:hypothetical protein